MKKIKSFYYEIVISKIYMLEKYKREFDEGNIYNGIWGTLQTLFVFTACIILFYTRTYMRNSTIQIKYSFRHSYLMSNSCQLDN